MPGTVRVRVLNVGQGDAIVGILPGGERAFVVDVYDADKVLDFLTEEGISQVVLFLSHSDRDHTAGVSDFIAEFPRNGRILGIFYNHDRLNARTRSEFGRLTQLIGQFSRSEGDRNPDFLYANFNTNLNRLAGFGDLFPDGSHLRVIHPEQADQSSLIGQDANETAGVLMVECAINDEKARRMLLAADVQLTGISLILSRKAAQFLEADVLKFPHHGAWPQDWPGISFVSVPRKTLKDFLDAVRPATVILSIGFNNPHGHVRREVFSLLDEYHRNQQRLKSVKCTQFTPTCFGSTSLRRQGPFQEPHCAGDVEIILGSDDGEDGVQVLTFPEGHIDRITKLDGIGRAGCRFLLDT